MPPVPLPVPETPDSPPPPPPTLRDRLFRPRWLVVIAGLIALPVLGPWSMQQLPVLEERSEYRLPFAQIQLEPHLPAELPPNFLEQVRQQNQLSEQISVLDPELPRILAEAFAAHPWVAEVVSVRNVYPATVTVELAYRQPVALVQVADGFYAVDASGILLPPADFDATAIERHIRIVGVQSRPRSAAGRRWDDPALQGAAKLAEFLGERWKLLGLSAIEIPEIANIEGDRDDPYFELRTAGGSRILWGRGPDSKHPGELAAGQKLGRLEKYLAEFGNFEQPLGPYEIDIRHWQEISRRPLGNPHANTARGPNGNYQR